MREKRFKAEKIINVRGRELKNITNLKLDLQLYGNRRREKPQEIMSVANTLHRAPKIKVKVNSVKAKATVRQVMSY